MKRFVPVFLLLLSAITVRAQYPLSVQVSVLPPYSTRLSDYTDNPGKIFITIQNTGAETQDFYLQLSLRCDDHGILLMANRNNSSGMQLSIPPYQVIQVNYYTLQRFFNRNVIEYQGITEKEILRMNGLPEGLYSLCVQAFSFADPLMALSNDLSCSNFFIQSIQPPMLILPEDRAGIPLQQPQNQVFSWTIPPGAPPGSFYRLTLIEMLDTTRPKEDYFNSGHFPPFFETTVSSSVFLYGPAQPPLVTGRKYAWAVTLTGSWEEPGQSGTSGALFINNGRSEVREFTCVPPEPFIPAVITDTVTDTVLVRGKLLYRFGDYAETHPVAGTQVRITRTGTGGVTKPGSNMLQVFPLFFKPLSEESWYTTTGADGSFSFEILVPGGTPPIQRKYRLEILSKYYSQPQEEIVVDSVGEVQQAGQIVTEVFSYSLKLYVNKLFASEYTPVINNGQPGSGGGFHFQHSVAIDSSITEAVREGIPVYIYRKTKIPGQPPVEGDQKSPPDPGVPGFVKIATAKTVRAMEAGRMRSYVIFNKLVCNVKEFADDVYYVIAGEDPGQGQGPGSGGGGGLFSTGVQLQNLFVQALEDTSFKAEEMPFRYSPFDNVIQFSPPQTSKYSTEGQYNIVSVEPPKSRIKGRMVYLWPGDAQQVVRPLANMPFKIQVEYLINGTPVPTYAVQNLLSQLMNTTCAGLVVNVDGTPMVLNTPDSRMVAGTGVTDNDGNFDIEVLNINHKGYLGTGSYMVSSTTTTTPYMVDPLTELEQMLTNPDAPIVNPNWGVMGVLEQNGLLNFENGIPGIQVIGNNLGGTQLLGGGNVLNPGAGGFKGGGPWADEHVPDASLDAPPDTQYHDSVVATGPIHRVYRIQLGGNTAPFYYNPSTNIICDAFEVNTIIEPVRVYVQEMKMTATIQKQSKENSKVTGGGIQAVVFRDPADKIPGLPAGEGDGLYRMKRLLWPDFGIPTAPGFSNELEWLWDETSQPQPSGSGSTVSPDIVSFDRLLINFDRYRLEACSDPSQGSQYFEPKILANLPKISNAGYGTYWDTRKQKSGLPALSVSLSLDPLPSRIGARVINHASDKAMGDVQVKILQKLLGVYFNMASGLTDKDGYIEFKGLVQQNNQQFSLKAAHPGFHQLGTYNTGPMDKYGSQYIQTALLMEPDAVLSSRVVNEKNQGVQSYVMRTDTSYELSQPDGRFSIALPSGSNTLYIIPVDVGYFPDTLSFTLAAGNNTRPDITVFRRKHRINFVVSEQGNAAQKIAGARLSMNTDLVKTTNQQGEAGFEFENISYQNFTVKVTGPPGTNYIPQLINFSNPETAVPLTYEIRLRKGGALSGKVRLNGTAVGGARICLLQQQQSTQGNPLVAPQLPGGQSGFNLQNTGFQQSGLIQNIVVTGPEPPGGNAVQVLQEGALPLFETYTDKQGNYTLRGIPVSTTQLEFNATLDTTFTVIGDSKQAAIQAGQTASLDFDLTRYDYMTIASVFGFPLKIEKLTPTGDENVVKVTGVIDLRFSESAFIFQQGTESARVRDVVFTGQMVDGKRIGFAAADPVSLEGMIHIKLRYTEKYNVSLAASIAGQQANWMQSSAPAGLVLRKDNQGKGYVEGFARITDNSFNYPSSYLKFNSNQDFHLCRIVDQAPELKIRAITARYNETEAAERMAQYSPLYSYGQWSLLNQGNTAPVAGGNYQVTLQQTPSGGMTQAVTGMLGLYGPFSYMNNVEFNLCNAAKDSLRMKLILFNAAADPFGSYISHDGSIHLKVRMKCHIPNAQPPHFTVDIPSLVLDNNQIQTASSNQSLKIAMEKWTLEVKDWSLSPVKGGFYSENAMLRTGQLDIPSRYFNLRNDMLAIGNFELQSVSLGNGLILLKDIDPARVSLLYDHKTGSDMGGHWRLSMSGEGNQPAARIYGFAQHLQEDVVELEYVQLLSCGENLLSIKQGKQYRVKRNPLAVFTPTAISSSDNMFALSGGLSLNAPRIAPFGVVVNFEKGQGTSLVSQLQPVNMSFTGKGNVIYQSSSTVMPKCTKDSLLIAGTVEEPGSLPALNATFRAIAQPERYDVLLKKHEAFRLFEKSGNDFQFVPDSGGMHADKQAGDWNYLCFAGKMLKKTAADNIGDNRMKFTVFGEIQVNGGGMQAGDLPGFPGFKMVYLLADKRLIGTMHIDKLELGAITLNGMDAEMRIDPSGWYLSSFGEILVNAFPIANLKAGLVIGNYPSFSASLKQTLLQYSPTANPCKFKSGISGFYMLAGKPLINKSWSQGFGPVGGSIRVNVGLEADFLMNFSEGSTTIYTGAGIYGLAKAELSSITCTDIYGEVDIRGRVEGGIFQNQLQLNGQISTGFKVKLEQGVPSYDGCCCYGTIFDACVGSRISAGSSGFHFSFEGDCSTPACE